MRHSSSATAAVVNPFLDETLRLQRESPRVALEPRLELGADRVPGKFRSRTLIHAGVISTVGQEAGWKSLGNGRAITTSVDAKFLSPAWVDGGEVWAVGRALREGNTFSVAVADVYQAGDPFVYHNGEGILIAQITTCFRVRGAY
jgi:acyl-coenzyme A thioesterase PaaI-like protein